MNSFSDIAIVEPIKKALDKMQFNTPTEIQQAAIPIGLEGKDIIACASTGSGKTAAFGIPALNMVLSNPDKNALILAPTRELAQQISEFMRELTVYAEGITMVSLVGGFDMSRQLNALRRKPRIIIATPGRLTDHLRRRTVNLSNTGILILDEGDRMLDMGFAPQLDVILQFLPQKRQTMMFTATLPPKVKALASKYLHKPQEVMVGNTSQPVDSVAQSAIVVPQDQKNDKLIQELNNRSGSVIVFARTQRRTDALTYFLEDSGVDAVAIHGGLTQGKRNRAIQGFKHGDYRVLVATDIAARGIDVPSVEHVVNFDLPLMDEDYVHRIGRTGRNGAKGEAVSFVSHQEFGLWSAIARKYNVKSDIADPRRGGKKKFGKGRSFGGDSADGERSFRPRRDFGSKREFGGKKEFGFKKDFGGQNDFGGDDFKRKKDNSFYTTAEFTPEEIQARDIRESAPREENFERSERPQKRSHFFEDGRKPRSAKTSEDSFSAEEQPQRRERSFDSERPRTNGRSFNKDGPREFKSEGRFERGAGGFKKKFSSGGSRFDRDDRSEKRSGSFGAQREFGEKRSFGAKREFGEKREFGAKRDFGAQREFGAQRGFGAKREFGEKREFGGKREFGAKREFGSKREFGPKREFSASKPTFRDRPARRQEEFVGGGEESPKRKSSWFSKDKGERRPFAKKSSSPAAAE